MRRKVLSALMVIAIIICSAEFTGVFAAETPGNSVANGSDYISTGVNAMETAYPEAYDALKKGIIALSNSVSISEYNVPLSDCTNLYNAVISNTPEIFYTATKYSYICSADKKYVLSYSLTYIDTEENIQTMKKEFDTAASELLYQAPESLTDEQAVVFYHDMIADMVQYDISTSVSKVSYTAYGAFVNHTAVCQGYTTALMYLLNERGIDTCAIRSESMNHMWLMAKVGGKYYHIDTTFDDALPDTLGRVRHTNLLLSDTAIKVAGSNGHTGFTSPYKASSTIYDNYWWKNVTSKICYNNGYWYYFNGNDLTRRSLSANTTEVIATIPSTELWYAMNKNSYYVGNYSKLAIKDGLIYYTTPTKVMTWNISKSSGATVYTLDNLNNGYIYGLSLVNDNITISIKTAPSDLDTDFVIIGDSLAGDVNGDGALSIKDVTQIQKYLVKAVSFTASQKELANVNGDSIISVKDGVTIQKRLSI